MPEERDVRLSKLEALRKAGMDPYPKSTERTHEAGELLASFDALAASTESIVLAGRIMTIRVHGGMMFADMRDESGQVQLVFKEDDLSEAFNLFRDCIDPGDFIEVHGTAYLTKRGEKSLLVTDWRILSKALLPLPEKWHGLSDVEIRFRQRELDLLVNPEVRQRFVIRSRLVSSMRSFLDGNGFLEVETPVLQTLAGGAAARPFTTHHNALGIDLYLRIAPELFLKRLVIGGMEKVYEIARCFRNEGIDHSHNPEFTQIELYWAYAGKERFLTFIESMVGTMLTDAFGSMVVARENGSLDFTGPWPRITFREAIKQATTIDIDAIKDIPALKAAVKAAKVKVDFKGLVGMGEHLDELYKKTARAKLTGPAWVLEYPVAMKPLAGRSPEDPEKSATAQLVVDGSEIINAYYYELNDPIDQRSRFVEQEALAKEGSQEAQPKDEEFLTALEHGMPPTSGMGMGIDRLVAILTGAPSLKEVILFPTLRPKQEE
ncbi:lysine--tRNA ligase [Candidatus Uhrbacteria bacterium]|nr:lysine--tRNA ligase [Candidatus Uhrbacteria bacterium]